MLGLFEYLKQQINIMEYPEIDAVSRIIDMTLKEGIILEHQHAYLRIRFEMRVKKVCSVGTYNSIAHYLTTKT